jgi:hypothetical protein
MMDLFFTPQLEHLDINFVRGGIFDNGMLGQMKINKVTVSKNFCLDSLNYLYKNVKTFNLSHIFVKKHQVQEITNTVLDFVKGMNYLFV